MPAGTEGVKVNTPIAVILTDGEDASALANGYAAKTPSPQLQGQFERPFSHPHPLADAAIQAAARRGELGEKDRMRGDSASKYKPCQDPLTPTLSPRGEGDCL